MKRVVPRRFVLNDFALSQVIWYHNDLPVRECENIQLEFKGDKCSLRIKNVMREHDGEYRVIAVNVAGETTTFCRLNVTGKFDSTKIRANPKFVPLQSSFLRLDCSKNVFMDEASLNYNAPKFTKLLTDVLVREGDTVVLECAACGNPKPDIKWILNNHEIEFSEHIKVSQK